MKAPVPLTGGDGFGFEDQVAALHLLNLLGGQPPVLGAFTPLVKLHWQARDMGWLADDLVAEFTARNDAREVGFSIKSDREVTSGGFPDRFVADCWRQWLGLDGARRIREGWDAIVLVVGWLSQEVDEAWAKLAKTVAVPPERALARLAPPGHGAGSQTSDLERKLFASFAYPAELLGQRSIPDGEAVRLLRHVYLVPFDFKLPTSRDEARALAMAQSLLRSGSLDQGRDLWRRLLQIASSRRMTGSAIDQRELVIELREYAPCANVA